MGAGKLDGRGWSDPDTRAAGLLVIGCVVLLVVLARTFHDVNAA